MKADSPPTTPDRPSPEKSYCKSYKGVPYLFYTLFYVCLRVRLEIIYSRVSGSDISI